MCLAEPKSKRFRLDTFSGIKTSPIKATYEFRCNEQVHKFRNRPKTSILVRPYWDTQIVGRNSIQIHEIPLWRGLLDSGSDGDLLFVRRGSDSTTTLPYLNRALTKSLAYGRRYPSHGTPSSNRSYVPGILARETREIRTGYRLL